jgi:hypothetical protein
VTRRQTILGLSIFAFLCLAAGIIWTLRTEPPSAHPWWAGKEAKVRIEVWEPGKDMPTVGMTLPKRTVDTMVALGMKGKIQAGHHSLDLREHWRKIQALPPGEKLKIEDYEATMYVWIETPDMKPVSSARPDSFHTAMSDSGRF